MPQLSITETLFGGLLMQVLLFAGVRFLSFGTFWAGLVSALAALGAYLVYVSQHWAGGDVLTIHLVVYLLTAALLIVLGGQSGKQHWHWAPKLIASFFVFLIIFNAVFLNIASRGLPKSISGRLLPNPEGQAIHTGFPGLVPHDRNKLYEPHLQRLEAQNKLGWKIDTASLYQLKAGIPAPVILDIRQSDGKPLTQAKVHLGFWRMANSQNDIHSTLLETDAGRYTGSVQLLQGGRWIADLSIVHKDGDFHKQYQLMLDLAKP